jgi:transposase
MLIIVMDIPQPIRDLVIQRHLSGQQSWRQIAVNMGLPKSTVSNILRRYEQSGLQGTQRIGRCGRKRALTERDEKRLTRASQLNPRATARQLRGEINAVVSISAIKRSLHRLGRMAFRPSKCPSFTREQQTRRLHWCRMHAHWTFEHWKRVSLAIFEDAKEIKCLFVYFRLFSQMKRTLIFVVLSLTLSVAEVTKGFVSTIPKLIGLSSGE